MANNGSAVVTPMSSSKTGGYNRDNSALERAVLMREKSNDEMYRNSDQNAKYLGAGNMTQHSRN